MSRQIVNDSGDEVMDMQLTLDTDEAQIVREYLGQCLIDLRGEIGGTDDRGLRQELHRREAILQRLVSEIGQQLTGVG
jgi:hypothetical protein